MIIQALKEYYDRKINESENDIAPEGFEKKALDFLIKIDKEGTFIGIEDLREKNKKDQRKYLLPRSENRTGSKSHETTFLLWDHTGYVLGLPGDKNSDRQYRTWHKKLDDIKEHLCEDEGVQAMCLFYERPDQVEQAKSWDIFLTLKKNESSNTAFQLDTDIEPVPCRARIRNFVISHLSRFEEQEASEQAICMITGEKGMIARTHGRTPINKDTKSLISFQKNSGYDSYGKEQAYNAPMIKSTEFAYTTALNTLLHSRNQRFKIGDTDAVVWSQKKSQLENDFSFFFSEPPKDNPDEFTQRVVSLFDSVRTGAFVQDDLDLKFYVLGLAPNSARISVRFWEVATISEMTHRVAQYFRDLEIVKPPGEPKHYSLWKMLVNIATLDKSENIPPNLLGESVRAIVKGLPFPQTLLQATLRRIRSDTDYRVKPIRAAIIKACLNRKIRHDHMKEMKEVTIALDETQRSIGYLLGRLFAVLEKVQEECAGKNTIRATFYGSACSSPVTVFPNLMRLKNHHIAKIEQKGKVVYYEKLLGSIIHEVDHFPPHLNLHEQGFFAIGYYHQRQDFYQKKQDTQNNNFQEEHGSR
jgi:CRISPR-associated protein Csd1